MYRGDKIGAVVHGDHRTVSQGGTNVPVISIAVLSLNGKDGDLEMFHKGRGDVILGGEGIGGAQHHISAPGLQGVHQVRRLGGDMKAGRNPYAFEGALFLKSLLYQTQNRHSGLSPLDSKQTLVC